MSAAAEFMPIPVAGGKADGLMVVRRAQALESIVVLEGDRYRLEMVSIEGRPGETEWRYVLAARPDGIARPKDELEGL